jgi:PAS domain S-box-containing protein
MNPPDPKMSGAQQLLAAAEAQVARHSPAVPAASPVEELLHELQVHQIELEMQNENLRQAQELLEASRDRYAALFEFAPVGYLTLDANGLIAEINLTGATLLGVERKHLLQRRFTALVVAADQNRWMQHFLRLKKGGERARVDLVLRRGDGSLFDALLDCERQEVGAGGAAIQVVLTDISERAPSKQSDDNFRAIFERSPIGIGIAGPDLRYRKVNPALCRMLGYSEEELLTKSFIDITHPDDAKLNLWNLDGLAAGEADHFTMEKRYVRKDGETVWVSLNVVAVRATSGAEAHTVGLAEDITERKRVENALRIKNIVFDASIAANSIADLPGVIVEANSAFLRLWGYQRKDQVIGKNIAEFFVDPGEAAAVVAALDQTGQWEGGFSAKRQDGSQFSAYALATTLCDDKGKPMGYQSAVIDITESRQAEQRRLGYARQQRDTLVREVHHRIKNNLQSVAGLLQRELGQFLELDPRLEAAISQVNAIAVVHGLQSINPDEAIRLCDSVGSICKVVADLSQRPVLFNIEHEQTAFRPVRIENSEAVSIALVLNELILNAVKHSPPGGAAPTVSLSADGSSAQLVIRNALAATHDFDIDTGEGLGTGLRLVRSLLPEQGAHLSYERDAQDFMLTRLKLRAPVVTKQDHRR